VRKSLDGRKTSNVQQYNGYDDYLPVTTHPAIGPLEINSVLPSHIMSNFPVNIVVGSNKSFSDEIHVFGCGFTNGTLEDDFTIKDFAIVVGGDCLGDTKGGTLDGCDGESESGDRELHLVLIVCLFVWEC